MERLTTRDANCADPKEIYGVRVKNHDYISAANRLAAYEDKWLMPEEVGALQKDWSDLGTTIGECGGLARVKELAEADKDGRVVVLPCKVGDTVWVTRNPWTGKLLKKPIDAYANGMKKFSHGLYVNLLFDTRKINGTRDYEINHIGKTIFLTREEEDAVAEQRAHKVRRLRSRLEYMEQEG